METSVKSKRVILIPQGCYGVIEKDTPDDVIGLYTTGIATCSGLVCLDDKREYLFLAHIDESSLLDTTEGSGLIKWLQKLVRNGVTLREIKFNICHSQGTSGIRNDLIKYRESIEALRDLIEAHIPELIGKVVIRTIHEHDNIIDCFVFRQNELEKLIAKQMRILDTRIKDLEQESNLIYQLKLGGYRSQKEELESQISSGEFGGFKLTTDNPVFKALGIKFDDTTDNRESAGEYYRRLSNNDTPPRHNRRLALLECYDGQRIISYRERLRHLSRRQRSEDILSMSTEGE